MRFKKDRGIGREMLRGIETKRKGQEKDRQKKKGQEEQKQRDERRGKENPQRPR